MIGAHAHYSLLVAGLSCLINSRRRPEVCCQGWIPAGFKCGFKRKLESHCEAVPPGNFTSAKFW